jgi:hypothetical protein
VVNLRKVWKEVLFLVLLLIVLLIVMFSKSPIILAQSTATNTPLAPFVFEPTVAPFVSSPTPYPDCPGYYLAEEQWNSLDPRWVNACPHCVPGGLDSPTSVFNLVTPTMAATTAPQYDFAACFQEQVEVMREYDVEVPQPAIEDYTIIDRGSGTDLDLVGVTVRVDNGASGECRWLSASNDAAGYGYIPDAFPLTYSFDGLDYQSPICFQGLGGLCEYFNWTAVVGDTNITFNNVPAGQNYGMSFSLIDDIGGDCYNSGVGDIGQVGLQPIFCPAVQGDLETSTPTPIPTNTPAVTNTPQPTNTPAAAQFYLDYDFVDTTTLEQSCVHAAPNNWYWCNDASAIYNAGDPIVGSVYTGTSSGNNTMGALTGNTFAPDGSYYVEYGSNVFAMGASVPANTTRSVCAASSFLGDFGAPSWPYQQVCDFLGFTTGSGYVQSSAGAYAIDTGESIHMSYRVGWGGGVSTHQISQAAVIRWGAGSAPQATNTPQPTNTPASTFTPSPSPTTWGTNGYCSAYQFRDDTPIVDVPDVGGFITAIEGQCIKLIPGVEFSLPLGLGAFEWNEYYVCPTYYAFPGLVIAGIAVGLELFFLIPIIAFVQKIVRF